MTSYRLHIRAVPDNTNPVDINEKNDCAFVKFGTGGCSASAPLLYYEAEGLKRLREAVGNGAVVPRVYAVGEQDEWSRFVSTYQVKKCNTDVPVCKGAFIAMEEVEMGGRKDDNAQAQLGTVLSRIHNSTTKHYGFPLDGCCGACPQLNDVDHTSSNWVDFWRDFRLGYQLDRLHEMYPSEQSFYEKGQQLLKRLPELFSMLVVEDIPPSLLHGDLWSGNWSTAQDGNVVLYDPAAYYGHSEADLGIARMFGGFSKTFWDVYHAEIPKSDGYERRLTKTTRARLYELHHHLNHYNIFGGGYKGGAEAIINELLKERYF